MADWFRWWHGSVTDQKFGAVCIRAKCSLPEAIAVWATLLEHASQAGDRGDVSDCPAEEIAWNLRMQPETVVSILGAMEDRGLLIEGRVAGWERRQPMREDAISADAKTSTERARLRRKRMNGLTETQCNADATQCNADATHQSRVDTEQIQNRESSAVDNSTGVAREAEMPATLLGPAPDAPDPMPTRRGRICRLLRQAGVYDAAPHQLTDETWDQILVKRTDEEIVEFAKAKLSARNGQRTGIKYLAPGLLQDPEPISTGPPARASPRMSREDSRRIAASTRLADYRAACEAEKANTDERTIETSAAPRLLG